MGEIAARYAAFPGSDAALAAFKRVAYVPPYLTPVLDAHIANDGRLWLKRTASSDSALWEVHDSRGTLLATISFPARFQLKTTTRDAIWGAELDADDVPHVVGYRIVR